MLGTDARAALSPTRFRDVRWFDEVDSTNRLVADLAREGAAEGVVVVADHQTAGRGRRGRPWLAPPNTSLLVSALVEPPAPPAFTQLVTVAAGVAASDACARAAGVRPLLKWPNDLVVADAKLGGILCELVTDSAAQPDTVVVGLGVNVNWLHPPAGLDGAVALSELCGHPVEKTELLVAFLVNLERDLVALGSGEGREDLLDRYRRFSATIDTPVQIVHAGNTVVGRAVDVSAEGHLVVEDAAGVRHQVGAGDVDHLRGP